VFDLAWLPFLNTYRTLCLAPDPLFRGALEEVRALVAAIPVLQV
jgi:hypothetical protein